MIDKRCLLVEDQEGPPRVSVMGEAVCANCPQASHSVPTSGSADPQWKLTLDPRTTSKTVVLTLSHNPNTVSHMRYIFISGMIMPETW